MRLFPPAQQGLSLVELLIGLVLTCVLMSPLLPMLDTAHAAARITAERNELERSADFALSRIATRVRATVPSTELASQPQDQWFDPFRYLVINGRLIEREGGGEDDEELAEDRILASSVTSFSLAAPAVDAGSPVVEIRLTLARGQSSTTASARVRMGSVE